MKKFFLITVKNIPIIITISIIELFIGIFLLMGGLFLDIKDQINGLIFNFYFLLFSILLFVIIYNNYQFLILLKDSKIKTKKKDLILANIGLIASIMFIILNFNTLLEGNLFGFIIQICIFGSQIIISYNYKVRVKTSLK